MEAAAKNTAGKSNPGNFKPKDVTKSAERKLTTPISNVTTFEAFFRTSSIIPRGVVSRTLQPG
jgi:hypothetical protein